MITDLVMDKNLYYLSVAYYHKIHWNKTPHMITMGASGSGKTFLNKLIIARVSLKIPNASVTVLDFKAADYGFCRGSRNLYEFENVKLGLERFYNEFLLRLQGEDKNKNFKLLVIEELASMLSYYPKKESEVMKSMISTMIAMGRSVMIFLILSTQRPNSEFFSNGSRDSIGVIIALGNLSKEGKAMLFNEFKDEMEEKHGQGSGFMTNGAELFSIKVPQISNIAKLEDFIKQAVNR